MTVITEFECEMCGAEFGTNCAVVECPECEAIRCPCCKNWFERD